MLFAVAALAWIVPCSPMKATSISWTPQPQALSLRNSKLSLRSKANVSYDPSSPVARLEFAKHALGSRRPNPTIVYEKRIHPLGGVRVGGQVPRRDQVPSSNATHRYEHLIL